MDNYHKKIKIFEALIALSDFTGKTENQYMQLYTLSDDLKKSIAAKVPNSYYRDGKLDVLSLCKDFNIDVYNYEFDDDGMSGAIVPKDDRWVIYVNKTDSPRRKRFTVAHELGHLFSFQENKLSKGLLDTQKGVIDYAFFRRNEDEKRRAVELEANAIAGEILMPSADVTRLKDRGKTVEEMAEYFDVSESAMTVRLMNLGYELFEDFSIQKNT